MTLEDVVAAIDQAVSKDEFARRKLRTLVSGCGYRKRTIALIDEMQSAFEQRGMYPRPKLTAWPDLDTYIEMTRQAYGEWEDSIPFKDEEELQAFICRNHRSIEPLRELTNLKREQKAGRGRCDLLGTDPDGTRVVIELKITSGGRSVASQLIGYIDAFLRQDSEMPVRGVVISARRNDAEHRELVRSAKDLGIRVDWYCFEHRLALHPVQP